MLVELSWSNVLEPSTSKTLYKLLKGCKAAAEIRKTSKNMHKLCPGYLSDVNVDCCLWALLYLIGHKLRSVKGVKIAQI